MSMYDGIYGGGRGAIWPLMHEHVWVNGMGLLGNPWPVI